jgi:hypothetical protein
MIRWLLMADLLREPDMPSLVIVGDSTSLA